MLDKLTMQKQRSGSTLVMALLIMVLIIGIGAGITFVLNTRVRVIQYSSQGVAAQYISDSLIELSLMRVTESRFNRLDYSATSAAISNTNHPGFLYGGAAKDVEVEETVASYKVHLREDESTTLDLIERDSGGLSFNELSALNLRWDPINDQEKLEVSWVGLDPSRDPVSGRTYLTTSDHTGEDIDFDATPSDHGYRVTVKSLFSGVNNLVMTPRKRGIGGGPPNIDPAFSVSVTGEFGKSRWTRRYVVPYRASATSLLQYVIFSDDVLSKPVIP